LLRLALAKEMLREEEEARSNERRRPTSWSRLANTLRPNRFAKEILSELDAAGQAKSKPAAEAVAIMLAAYSTRGDTMTPMPRRPPTA